ncbi:MAG: hypothetical protein KKF20_06000, partial [Bacteroidetes bacterium]|nr:hypothetical protein [Bacteroidota bacterium]
MFKKVKFFSGKELEEWQKKGLVLLTNKLKVLRNTKFCFFFLILIPVNILFAQKLHIKNYTTDDGLPTAQVWCSLQDSKGYMWFGTSGGLVRFDGV